MKQRDLFNILGAVVALTLTFVPVSRAEDTPAGSSGKSSTNTVAQPPTNPAVAPAAIAAESAAQPSPTTAPYAEAAPAMGSAATGASPVAEEPASEASITPAPQAVGAPAAAAASSSGLRRLDRISEESAGDGHTRFRDAVRSSMRKHVRTPRDEGSEDERVSVLHDVIVQEGEKTTQAVAVLGDATVDGEAAEQAVSVWGNTTVNGSVGDQAVSVLGNTTINGSVGNQAVAVGGNMTINGHVGGQVVCVGGDLTLGPDADVGGEVVVVGGEMKRDSSAVVHGHVEHVRLPVLRPLFAWVSSALLKGRLLSFDPRASWAWVVAAFFLGLYVLLALVFPRGMTKCVETLEQRPGHVILTALLTLLAMPLVFVLLAITGIGILVIPFLGIGLYAGRVFGRAAMMAWFGRRLTGLFGTGAGSNIILCVLYGGIIVGLLYTVPILALVVAIVVNALGLGTVIYTLILNMRKSGDKTIPPATAVPHISEPRAPAAAVALVAGAPAVTAAGATSPAIPPAIPTTVPAPAVPPAISAVTFPRAGFWIRTGALLIDGILCAIILKLVPFAHFSCGGFLLVLAIYGAVMWKLRGTTVGGSICRLKVVRVDDRPLDWTCAIVRALSCFLSLAVVGFGFIWVAFDDEKQSWHDKIAGTTVVTVPKGVALI